MATVIAVLIAVMVDRYAQLVPAGQALTRVRSTTWLNSYLVKCINLLDKIGIKQTYLIILSAVLPLCIGLFIIKLLSGMVLGWLGTMIFVLLTLFYFLGFRASTEDSSSAFVTVHEQSFGVLFWFGLLGPTGALLYWFLVVSRQSPVMLEPINDGLNKGINWLHAMAAWIPARITGFIYALVGNFDPGFQTWKACIRDPKLASSQVLNDCGRASMSAGVAGEEDRLVLRAFIAWVVVIILIILM